MNDIENKNSSDFKTNQSSEEQWLETYKYFAADFAGRIISQDFLSAHQFLAPWLQAEMSPEDLRQAFEKELWEMNGSWDLEELIFPTDFSLSWNSSTLESLKEPVSWRVARKISPRITGENFRKWMVIEFLPAENDDRIEFDGWFDFWFVLAEVNGEVKIGFFEFEDVD